MNYHHKETTVLTALLCGLIFTSFVERAKAVIDPVSNGIVFLIGNAVNKAYDKVTGKPDVKLLEKCLRELEANVALRAEVREEIRKLRERIDESATLEQLNALASEMGSSIAVIEERVGAVEEKAERLEVLVEDGSELAQSAGHFLVRAMRCVGEKQYFTAIANCDLAVALEPENALLYLERGKMYEALGSLPEIIAIDCGEAIRLDSKMIEAYSLRAKQWLKMEELEKAVEDLTCAIALNSVNDQFFSDEGRFISRNKCSTKLLVIFLKRSN